MEALILGCGRVGSETAKALVHDGCNVTVVDNHRPKLVEMQAMYDMRAVFGNAADPAVLREAGGEDAEIVIAVTAIDEVNLVACRLCHSMFKTPKTIARLRASTLNTPEISSSDGFNITHIFCPEQIVADNICDTIRHPGCLSVHRFSSHEVALASVRVLSEGEMAGDTINAIRKARPEIDFRIMSIWRDGKILRPGGSDRLFVGDEISLVIAEKNLNEILVLLAGESPVSSVMIVGGGNIGERVGAQIQDDFRLKIIDISRERCEYLSGALKNALVLKGGGSDENMLEEEGIRETDMFCAITNDDEENILSAMLAKDLGAKRNIVLVNRVVYAGILGRLLDNVVSPAELSIGAILTHIRVGDINVVHSLHRGKAEVIEVVVHGDSQSSSVVGRSVSEINWPADVMLGALVRGGDLLVAHDDTRLQDDDRLIILMAGGKARRQTTKLLQVGMSYF